LNVIQIANGEAISVAKLMKLYRLQETKMNGRNANTAEEEADAIERNFHATINAIVNRDLPCADVTDALTALRYVQCEFKGDDGMADALLGKVVAWLHQMHSAVSESLTVANTAMLEAAE
jgi:hypothetical protein